MDQAARPAGSAAVAADGNGSRDPEEIRREIEHTREDLADTAAALAYKADVKGRAKEKVAEMKSTVTEKTDEVRTTISDATPGDAAAKAEDAKQVVRDKPLPFAVGVALAAGLLVGYLIATRRGH